MTNKPRHETLEEYWSDYVMMIKAARGDDAEVGEDVRMHFMAGACAIHEITSAIVLTDMQDDERVIKYKALNEEVRDATVQLMMDAVQKAMTAFAKPQGTA